MPLKPEPPPTKEELKRAVSDLFYAASQAASFGYLRLIQGAPQLTDLGTQIPGLHAFLHSSFLELSLLFIRKTTEFFKSRHKKDENDTLFAYRYFPHWEGVRVVDRDLYAEMHKRVGHITVMQARYGAFNWPIEQMTFQALDQWISFFGELRTSWIYDGSPPEEELRNYQAIIQAIADGCRRALSGIRVERGF